MVASAPLSIHLTACIAVAVCAPCALCAAQAFENKDMIAGQVALVQRGVCSFVEKAAHAQNAGAAVVMIYDNNQDNYGDWVGRGTLFCSAVPLCVVCTGMICVHSTHLAHLLVNCHSSGARSVLCHT